MARRRITEEEHALLEHAMRAVKPLKKGRIKAQPAPKAQLAVPSAKPSAKPPAAKERPAPPAKNPATAKARTLRAIDRRTDQKLKRGKITPDATLDLHGLSQARAHARLISFLTRASADGERTVLVITGKGSPRADASGELLGLGRGVLREAVPHWLEEPPLSELIWGIRTAGPRQGGQGALYVLLKKRKSS